MRPQSTTMKASPTHPLLVPAIAASQFAPPFMISGVAVALPALGADLGAGATSPSLVEPLSLAVSVAVLAPIHFMLPAAWRWPAPRAVHLPSTLLAVAAMLALVGGAATLREGTLGYAATALGVVLLAVFVFSQRRLAQPLLNVDVLMRNR